MTPPSEVNSEATTSTVKDSTSTIRPSLIPLDTDSKIPALRPDVTSEVTPKFTPTTQVNSVVTVRFTPTTVKYDFSDQGEDGGLTGGQNVGRKDQRPRKDDSELEGELLPGGIVSSTNIFKLICLKSIYFDTETKLDVPLLKKSIY